MDKCILLLWQGSLCYSHLYKHTQASTPTQVLKSIALKLSKNTQVHNQNITVGLMMGYTFRLNMFEGCQFLDHNRSPLGTVHLLYCYCYSLKLQAQLFYQPQHKQIQPNNHYLRWLVLLFHNIFRPDNQGNQYRQCSQLKSYIFLLGRVQVSGILLCRSCLLGMLYLLLGLTLGNTFRPSSSSMHQRLQMGYMLRPSI